MTLRSVHGSQSAIGPEPTVEDRLGSSRKGRLGRRQETAVPKSIVVTLVRREPGVRLGRCHETDYSRQPWWEGAHRDSKDLRLGVRTTLGGVPRDRTPTAR